jgi:hypothetical protein
MGLHPAAPQGCISLAFHQQLPQCQLLPPEYNSISLLLEPPTANEHQSLKLCVWDMGWARPPFYIPGEKKLGPSNEEGIPGIS